jgi:hypothetical protein
MESFDISFYFEGDDIRTRNPRVEKLSFEFMLHYYRAILFELIQGA